MNNCKKLDKLIQNGPSNLQFILKKVNKIQEVNKIFHAYLDPQQQKYCQVVNACNNELFLLTANSATATQLRFQSPDILARLRRCPELKHITRLNIRVSPMMTQHLSHASQPKKQQPVAKLSAETAHIILKTAENLDDPKLSAIMARIAAHCKD